MYSYFVTGHFTARLSYQYDLNMSPEELSIVLLRYEFYKTYSFAIIKLNLDPGLFR